MIKGIILDWSDTLALPGIPEGYFPAERIKKRFGLSDEAINQCLEIIEKFEVLREPRTIEEQREILTNCYQTVVNQIKLEEPDRFIKYLLDWGFEKVTPILYPEVLDVIKYLTKKNYILIVLSNGWPTKLLEIKRTKVAKFLQKILISNIIGAAKPDPKAYQIAIKEIGFLPNEILFVDNKEKYIAPAKDLGMKTILMDRENINQDSSFARIRNLSEIATYLEDK